MRVVFIWNWKAVREAKVTHAAVDLSIEQVTGTCCVNSHLILQTDPFISR